MKRILLISAMCFFAVGSFVYGIGVGNYHWFPYAEIRDIRNLVLSGVVRSFHKKAVACPSQDGRIGVLLAIGQSNVANSLERMIAARDVPDVVNFFDGKCYEASSPMLGATNFRGEFLSLLGQKLVDASVYDKVLVIAGGVGGSSTSQWVKGAELNDNLLSAVEPVSKTYRVTAVVWHQGEADLASRMLKDVYKLNFLSLKETLRSAGIEAPIFISAASVCDPNWESPNQITEAQLELAAEHEDVVLAADTDNLVPPELRFDGCHFGSEGQELVAHEYALAIAGYYQSPSPFFSE
jgi:hypothetical protein